MADYEFIGHKERFREAIRWMSHTSNFSPAGVEEASQRFDLSPLDEEFLLESFVKPMREERASRCADRPVVISVPTEEFLEKRGLARLRAFRPWFLILLLLGLLSLGVILFSEFGLLSYLAPSANADTSQSVNAVPIEHESSLPTSKEIVSLLVLILLGAAYLVALVKLLRSENEEVIKLSFHVTETLTGFFIGLATRFV